MKIGIETVKDGGIIVTYRCPYKTGPMEKKKIFTSFWGMIDFLCDMWGISK
jgi:hypothetical protein